ncbi:MAG: URC4/urg3 family protein [Gammaproteobacteria bacterium]|nr:URC4/urg3 family protein [Gammaproteobacteria bacterium]
MKPQSAESAAVARLRTLEAVRERCAEILARAETDALRHFRLHHERIDAAVDYVLATIESSYPDLDIPFHSRWRHFHVGGVDRWGKLADALAHQDADELARTRIDLVVTSVLLDAGAGDSWRYLEPASGNVYARSEGLAVASLDLFASGAFSARDDEPLRADARALTKLSQQRLEQAFQVRADNPLVGIAGRVELMRRLGEVLVGNAALFGADEPRIGNLFDYLAGRARDNRLQASTIFSTLVSAFAPIWPGRLELAGENLGDVWHHSAIRRGDPSNALVPFHKLSQWLTYSLVEPLEARGIRVVDLDALTGLAEYRNGGLLLDLGVLAWKDPRDAQRTHDVASEPVVEWRALTVALLDALAVRLRARLGVDAERLPLVKVLEGGTWSAGRRIARERRAGGGPPIAVTSDGTVF